MERRPPDTLPLPCPRCESNAVVAISSDTVGEDFVIVYRCQTCLQVWNEAWHDPDGKLGELPRRTRNLL